MENKGDRLRNEVRGEHDKTARHSDSTSEGPGSPAGKHGTVS